jgi:hypothetical protein
MFRLELRLSFDSGTYGWGLVLVLVVIGLNGLSRLRALDDQGWLLLRDEGEEESELRRHGRSGGPGPEMQKGR